MASAQLHCVLISSSYDCPHQGRPILRAKNPALSSCASGVWQSNSQRYNCLNDGTVAHRHQPHICVYAQSSCGSAEGPHAPINSCGRQGSKQHRHLSRIQVRSQNQSSQCFQDTGRRGGAGRGGDEEEHGRERLHQYFYSLLPATQRACKHCLSGRTYAAKGESKKVREKAQ